LTLIIAVPGEDFVIVGADSRGVNDFGSGRVETNIHRKIVRITKYASILMYGSAEECNQLVEKYREQLNPELEDVKSVAEDFCRFCQDEERVIADVPRHPDSWTSFGFIVCGIKIRDGSAVPLIYNLRNYNGFRLGLCTPYAIKGKPLIAHYLFARDYRNEMTVNELCKLTAQAIFDTMQIDGDVGGPIRMAIIDSDGTREVSDSDVNNYVETWHYRNLQRIINT